jgi:hypothetical protein
MQVPYKVSSTGIVLFKLSARIPTHVAYGVRFFYRRTAESSEPVSDVSSHSTKTLRGHAPYATNCGSCMGPCGAPGRRPLMPYQR